MQFEWIIFDLDGTLFDYDSAEREALKKTFFYFKLPFDSEFLSIYRKYNRKVWNDFEQGIISIEKLKVKRFERLLNHLRIVVDPVSFSKRYLEHLGIESHLIPGAERVLKQLHNKVGLILMTNGIKAVQRSRLDRSPISHLFSDIIISDEVGVAKPAKEIFELAMSRINNASKNKVLMVGDNLSSDIKGGSDFGIYTCWYNPTDTKSDPEIQPDFEIRSLDEILHIVNIS